MLTVFRIDSMDVNVIMLIIKSTDNNMFFSFCLSLDLKYNCFYNEIYKVKIFVVWMFGNIHYINNEGYQVFE